MTLDVAMGGGPTAATSCTGPRVPSLSLPRSAPDLTADDPDDLPGHPAGPSSSSPSPKSRKNSCRWQRSPTHHPRALAQPLPHYHHHGRSQSVRAVKRPNRLELPGEFRSRVSSMPLEVARFNPRLLLDDEDYYRLRSFSITSKGVINRGDSFRSRRSKSNTSVASGGAGCAGDNASRAGSNAASAASSYEEEQQSAQPPPNQRYRVVMLGANGVGKSALTSQFMTSEYMNAYDSSLDDDYGEKTVSVLLDGDESEMLFIDHPTQEMSVENCIVTYEPHAYVVVYSITERSTFQVAEDILSYLWKGDYMRTKAVILVGNKTDLVRTRALSVEEGKSLATSHDCKFIETSCGINYNVDELLVGILSQIRLKQKRSTGELKEPDKKGKKSTKYKGARTMSLRAKGLINRLCKRDNKSKSCENLHVL